MKEFFNYFLRSGEVIFITFNFTKTNIKLSGCKKVKKMS